MNITKEDLTLVIAIIGCVLGIFNFYFSIKKYKMEKPNIEVIDVDIQYSISHIDLIEQTCFLKGEIYYELYNKSIVCPICIKKITGYFRTQQDYDGLMKNKFCRFLDVQPKVVLSGEHIKSKSFFINSYIKFEKYSYGKYFIIKLPEDFIIDYVKFDYGCGTTSKITLESRYKYDSEILVNLKDVEDNSVDYNKIIINSSLILDKRKLLINDFKRRFRKKIK